MGRNDWTDSPTLKAPFAVFHYGNEFVGEWFTVLDGEGRHITHDFHAEKFMNELCAVMNENANRLVNAWKCDVETKKRNKKCRKGERTSP